MKTGRGRGRPAGPSGEVQGGEDPAERQLNLSKFRAPVKRHNDGPERGKGQDCRSIATVGVRPSVPARVETVRRNRRPGPGHGHLGRVDAGPEEDGGREAFLLASGRR